MQWTDDVSAGAWLRERIDAPWRGTMHDAVPRGFAAYARVLHPTTRSRPVDRPWPPFPEERHRREWDAFAASRPEIETVAARWGDAADAFGTALHPLAQWASLVGTRHLAPGETATALSRDGWAYDPPLAGELDAETLAAVVAGLVGDDPAPGFAAVWAGWGGLLGHEGIAPNPAAVLFETPDDPAQRRVRETLAHSVIDPFNRPYAQAEWQPGMLPDEVSRGTLLALPGREHVLFHGVLALFTDPGWADAVPWRDPDLGRLGTRSPSLLWPADRSWVLVTDVDWDSTIVGGPASVVEALCADPAVEALPLPPEADLRWDADRVNV
ncbi:hypothetical protein [Microbacterium sp. GXF7504]